MMNKSEIYALLSQKGVWHEITEHKAVYTMEELADVACPYPEADAKNLFVRDDKHRSYYLITVKGDKRVDLKAFRKAHALRPLTFASEEELKELLGLYAGAVSPFGTLNDTEHRVKLYLDADFVGEGALIGIHPNDNTATVWLKTADLIALLRENGTDIVTVSV